MNTTLRQRLDVMLDLAMDVADQARCTCPRVEPVNYNGHQAGCDDQVARNVLHTSARLLNMDKAERELAVVSLRRQLDGE